jgi:IPT/TIG domain
MRSLRRVVRMISLCSLLGACNGSQSTPDAAAGVGGGAGSVGEAGNGGSTSGSAGDAAPAGTGGGTAGSAGVTGGPGGSVGPAAGRGGGTAGSAAGRGGTGGSTGGRGGAAGATGGRGGAAAGAGSGGGGAGGQGNAGGSGQTAAGLALFFSDLTSGPNKGGQNDNGAFVTVFGLGFGSAQGNSTVTVGGGTVAAYPIWTNSKITFQLGAAAANGSIVVHVDGKGDTNALPFTVRAGNIYFVTASGSDSNNGAFATPWKTIPKAKNTIAAGDIAYLGKSAGDVLSQTTEDSTAAYHCALGMSANDGANSGTASAPKALVAYPGARHPDAGYRRHLRLLGDLTAVAAR